MTLAATGADVAIAPGTFATWPASYAVHNSKRKPMTGRTLILLKLVMWVVAGMHLVVGIGLMVAPGFAQFMADVYQADVSWTPPLRYILRPLGAFMAALGLIAIAAARDPVRYRAVLYAFVFLFAARAAQRLLCAAEIQQAFGISAPRNYTNMIFFTFLAAAIIVLDRVAQSQDKMSDV